MAAADLPLGGDVESPLPARQDAAVEEAKGRRLVSAYARRVPGSIVESIEQGADGHRPTAEGDKLEVPARVAFLVSYGAACAMAAHLHYRLAYLYAVTFEDPRGATRPRVFEKFNQSFADDMTIGRLWGLVRESQPPALRHTVDCAVSLRNYLVHFLIWDTRVLQGSEAGLEALAERLDVARDYLAASGEALHARHGELLIAAGATPGLLAQWSRPWDELGPVKLFDVKVPARLERIVRAWYAPAEVPAPHVYLENAAGDFWQFNENGLTECGHDTVGSGWEECSFIQAHLPADVVSRPSKKGNPRDWRSPFNYDLRLSTGVAITLEKPPGADFVSFELRPRNARARGGAGKVP